MSDTEVVLLTGGVRSRLLPVLLLGVLLAVPFLSPFIIRLSSLSIGDVAPASNVPLVTVPTMSHPR